MAAVISKVKYYMEKGATFLRAVTQMAATRIVKQGAAGKVADALVERASRLIVPTAALELWSSWPCDALCPP